jgi:hypothetical protein
MSAHPIERDTPVNRSLVLVAILVFAVVLAALLGDSGTIWPPA